MSAAKVMTSKLITSGAKRWKHICMLHGTVHQDVTLGGRARSRMCDNKDNIRWNALKRWDISLLYGQPLWCIALFLPIGNKLVKTMGDWASFRLVNQVVKINLNKLVLKNNRSFMKGNNLGRKLKWISWQKLKRWNNLENIDYSHERTFQWKIFVDSKN